MTYDLSIIVPAYNEAKSIPRVLDEIYNKIIASFPGTAEVVIVEDGSTDGTKEILMQLQKERKFRLVTGVERKGYNRALKDALSLAQGTYVFLSDSGGGHEMSDFFKLYQYAQYYSIVSGYKKKRHDPFHRILLSRVYNLYISALFAHRFYDIDCGFKIYHKAALDQVLPQVHTLQECITTEIVLRIYKQGGNIKEVPITHYARKLEGPARTFSMKKIPVLVSRLFLDLIKLRKEI